MLCPNCIPQAPMPFLHKKSSMTLKPTSRSTSGSSTTRTPSVTLTTNGSVTLTSHTPATRPSPTQTGSSISVPFAYSNMTHYGKALTTVWSWEIAGSSCRILMGVTISLNQRMILLGLNPIEGCSCHLVRRIGR